VTALFATTRWSTVLAARGPAGFEARRALEELCAAYWYPLYAFVRRQGEDAEAAQDLVQGFFVRFLERDALARVAPERGRFRSFLLACLRHHLSDERDRARAKRRGGRTVPLPLDFDTAEGRYVREPSTDLTPERLYERRWALTLLERVLGELRSEYEEAGKGALFEALQPHLAGDATKVPHADLAKSLGMSEGAVKVALHRLRRRYRERLRAEIAETVDSPEAVDDEIRHLFEALGQ
jgi:RNA polymerase sigma factor (sigma-70 family)